MEANETRVLNCNPLSILTIQFVSLTNNNLTHSNEANMYNSDSHSIGFRTQREIILTFPASIHRFPLKFQIMTFTISRVHWAQSDSYILITGIITYKTGLPTQKIDINLQCIHLDKFQHWSSLSSQEEIKFTTQKPNIPIAFYKCLVYRLVTPIEVTIEVFDTPRGAYVHSPLQQLPIISHMSFIYYWTLPNSANSQNIHFISY